MVEVLVFILPYVDEEVLNVPQCTIIWMQGNMKSFSFEKLKLCFSFDRVPKVFESKYFHLFAIILHIKSNHESSNFSFIKPSTTMGC